MATKKTTFGHTQKPKEINRLSQDSGVLVTPPTPSQIELFHVEKQKVIDGVEMGVLDNGTPYLSESGLARMCGIDRTALNRMANNWAEERQKERGKAIYAQLLESGYTHDSLYLKSELGGFEINAYTEPVCLAVLEYYAFTAREPKEEAKRAYRALARVKFREFVYGAVGYSPEQKLADSWKHFHDRVDLTKDSVQLGYFSVFREVASMIVPMISSGVPINDKVIPDISVGIAWSAHWVEKDLSSKYGERTRYDHSYPDYYPQAKSNPQPSYAYPDAALGEFKRWLRQNYIKDKFPTYMIGQAKKGAVPASTATMAVLALSRNAKVTAPKSLPR